MINNVIFSHHKTLGPLRGKKLSFVTNNKPNKFIILYGKIGSGKTLFLNCFKNSLNFFNLYKNILLDEKQQISEKTLEYEKQKCLIDDKCYCQFQILGNKGLRKYWSFYPTKLNLHRLYPGSTISKSNDGKKRKEFKNFIHVNFSNYKKYNSYSSIHFNQLPKQINSFWLIIYDEVIWWLHYIVMILYIAKDEKLKEPITIKITQPKDVNWVKKIFESMNNHLTKVKLKILDDLAIVRYKNGDGHILLKFQKENTELTSNQLSSGEWQYVLTILFLVIKSENLNENKKKSKIYDPVVFVDQPEDNFDPLLQTCVIDAYIHIFPKNTQFFISTHSPFIIHNLINTQKNNCLLYNFNNYRAISIVNQDDKNLQFCDTLISYKINNNIIVSQHEINYLVFEISTFEYFLELYYTIWDKIKNIQEDKNTKETSCMKKFFNSFFAANSEKYENLTNDILNFRNSRCHINFKKEYSFETLKKYIVILREMIFWHSKQ